MSYLPTLPPFPLTPSPFLITYPSPFLENPDILPSCPEEGSTQQNTGNKVIDWLFSVESLVLKTLGQRKVSPVAPPSPKGPTTTTQRLERSPKFREGQNQSARKESLVISESLQMNTEL